MSSHSLAPWNVQDNTTEPHGQLRIDSAAHGAVAICYTMEKGETVTPAECFQNARLIAAAPDLLAALQMVAGIWSRDQTANIDPESPLAKVRTAIKKATGENV
jgi:hypothetical protein